SLGLCEEGLGNLAEAEKAYRQAIALMPNHAVAHCSLGMLLARQGRLTDSLTELRLGDELGSKQPGWNQPSAKWVRLVERMSELDAKLPRVLDGQVKPANTAELLDLARLCVCFKNLHVTGLRFYEQAFAEQPASAEKEDQYHRYYAACAAALAGCGQGKDIEALGDVERARLRQQALSWLRADLKAWTQRVD